VVVEEFYSTQRTQRVAEERRDLKEQDRKADLRFQISD
jgi:hypothetical protein